MLGLAAAQAALTFKASHPRAPIFVLGLASAGMVWTGANGVVVAVFSGHKKS
jgi:hypothetical protein